jgi:hypothetical protein
VRGRGRRERGLEVWIEGRLRGKQQGRRNVSPGGKERKEKER